MKRICLIAVVCAILPLSGCLPRAMNEAHQQQGIILRGWKAKADELYEAALLDWEATAKDGLDTTEAWMLERAADEERNVSLGQIDEIKAQRKDIEAVNRVKFAELRAKWKHNNENFEAALQIHEAVGKWLSMTGLF